jgi:PPOX class probable F420-dependent enzyme
MNHDEMRARVAEARVGRLATITADGGPHLVPCCFALAGDIVYSAVDAKPKSTLALRRLANVRANPRAALLVDFYADDWSTLWWVRIDGRARVIESGEERDAATALLTAKYDQYTSQPPPGPVLAIDIVTWRAWP